MFASTLYFLDNQALPYLHLIFWTKTFSPSFFFLQRGEEKERSCFDSRFPFDFNINFSFGI